MYLLRFLSFWIFSLALSAHSLSQKFPPEQLRLAFGYHENSMRYGTMRRRRDLTLYILVEIVVRETFTLM